MTMTEEQRTINELSSAVYTATIVNGENEVPIPLSSIQAIRLTHRDVATGTIINNRNRQDVLNDNQVTYHPTSGLLTWEMAPEDNVIVGIPAEEYNEEHQSIFEIITTEGQRKNYTLTTYIMQIGALPD